MAEKRNERLSPWFVGPYEITMKVGQVTYYQPWLPAESRVHPVFLVSLVPNLCLWYYQLELQVVPIKEVIAEGAEVLVEWNFYLALKLLGNHLILMKNFQHFLLEDKVKLVVGRKGIWAQKAPCPLMCKVSCIEEYGWGENGGRREGRNGQICFGCKRSGFLIPETFLYLLLQLGYLFPNWVYVIKIHSLFLYFLL